MFNSGRISYCSAGSLQLWEQPWRNSSPYVPRSKDPLVRRGRSQHNSNSLHNQSHHCTTFLAYKAPNVSSAFQYASIAPRQLKSEGWRNPWTEARHEWLQTSTSNASVTPTRQIKYHEYSCHGAETKLICHRQGPSESSSLRSQHSAPDHQSRRHTSNFFSLCLYYVTI